MRKFQKLCFLAIAFLMVPVFPDTSCAFLELLFPKYFNERTIPTTPNPVVLMAGNIQFDNLYLRVTNALRSINYRVEERKTGNNSAVIKATLYTRSVYAAPEPEDLVQGAVTVEIRPEKEAYIVSVKGVRFSNYVIGRHKPEFLVAGDVAKAIEQAMAPDVISGDIPGPDYFVYNTDYKVSDIDSIMMYCRPDTERSRMIADPNDRARNEIGLCQRQLEVLGGHADRLPQSVQINMDYDYMFTKRNLGQDHVRIFEKYVRYYRFKMEIFNSPKGGLRLDTPYEVTTVIKFKDGKTLTFPGLKEDLFRKRMF